MSTTLKEIIEYSKKNPNTDYARQALENIKSGKWDEKAKAEGIDLSFAGRSNYSVPEPKTPEPSPIKDKLGSIWSQTKDFAGDIKDTAVDLKKTAVDTVSGVKDISTDKDFTTPQKVMGVLGKIAGGISGAVGDVAEGVVKTTLKPEEEASLKGIIERAAQPIAESEIVGNVKQWYDSLDKDSKLFVDSAGGVLALMADIATLKGSSAAVPLLEKTVEKTVDVGSSVAKGTVDATKGAIDLTKGAVSAVTPDLSKLSPGIIDSVNKMNPTKRVEFKTMTGKSEGEWLLEKGIVGDRETTVTKLLEDFTQMRQNVDEALDAMPGTYRDPRVTTVADEAAESAKAMEAPEAGRMAEMAEKAKGVGLTPKEINELKRWYERNVKLGYMKDPTKTSEAVSRATNRDAQLREYLFEVADQNGFSNLRDINKEIQASRFLADNIAGKLEGQGANNLVGLTDNIILAPALLNPKAIAGFVGKKFLSSEGFKSFLAKALAGFPNKKPLPEADLATIRARADEVMKKQEDLRIETEKSAILADELQKAGFTMSEGPQGFIMKDMPAEIVDMPITKQEQALIRAAENRDTQLQMVQYIIEQRANGMVVGEGFVMKPAEPSFLQLPEPSGQPVGVTPNVMNMPKETPSAIDARERTNPYIKPPAPFSEGEIPETTLVPVDNSKVKIKTPETAKKTFSDRLDEGYKAMDSEALQNDARKLPYEEFVKKYEGYDLDRGGASTGAKPAHAVIPKDKLIPTEAADDTWESFKTTTTEKFDKNKAYEEVKKYNTEDFAPVLVEESGGEYFVIDGHHRVANLIADGAGDIPVYFDRRTLQKMWEKANGKKVTREEGDRIYKAFPMPED